jgi:hypothetical protein
MDFKGNILRFVIEKLVIALLDYCKPDEIKVLLDEAIDFVEHKIETSPNGFDDTLLPVLKVVRDVFDIPDLPDPRG